MPPKYPLEPLAHLRERKLDLAVRALGVAVHERDAASSARRTAEQRRDEHRQSVARERSRERDVLLAGGLRAIDLLQAAAWSLGLAATDQMLEGRVEQARAAEDRLLAAERAARSEALARGADSRAVAEHRARWEQRQRKILEAREEEAAADARRPAR